MACRGNFLGISRSFGFSFAKDRLGAPPLVYEEVKSFYKEEDETVPVNIYGKSKVAAE